MEQKTLKYLEKKKKTKCRGIKHLGLGGDKKGTT